MPAPGSVAAESARFAARLLADPASAVGRWRSVAGGKAVGCLPPIPVPEILHAAGLLSIPFRSPEIPPGLLREIDAWVLDANGTGSSAVARGTPWFVFPSHPPAGIADSLDRMEALAGWAGSLSGRLVTEGALRKSLRAFRERRDLLSRLAMRQEADSGGLSAEDIRLLLRAGDVLPPEAHSRLLARVLGIGYPPPEPAVHGREGDPLIELAGRLSSLSAARRIGRNGRESDG